MTRNSVRDFLEYIPFRLAVGLLDLIPIRAGYALGRSAGAIAWALLKRRRKTAIANVLKAGITADVAEARRIARASFSSFSMVGVEALAAMRLVTPDALDRHVEIVMPPATRELMDDPRQGVIVVSAHLGNWELAGHIASFHKKVVAVARSMNNPHTQRYLLRRNPRMNMEIVQKHSSDSLSLLRPLKSGLLLGLIADQHAASHGIQANFFGHPAMTVVSPARLHLATGCPLFSAFCLRTGLMTFKLVFGEPMRFEKTADRQADILKITQTMNDQIEAAIRLCPEQYLWAHRRWR
ncbi:MAG: lysophospholipid acyltransferase family protein [Kiritimatiellia bacterium]|jgi:KDO2-lipid IV(A) lauroyltransferase